MQTSKLYLRLGSHSEKDYLLKTAKLFTGVIVGANLVESTPGATVSLALNLIGGMKLEFAIDPMTYTYGMPLAYISSETIDRSAKVKGARKTGLKKSFASLANQFGGVIEESIVGAARPVAPADLSGRRLQQLCEVVRDYQLNRMKQFCEADPQLHEVAGEFPFPSFIFSPYFYIPDSPQVESRAWESTAAQIAEVFGGLASPVPKYSVICISRQGVRDSNRFNALAQSIASTGCDGCWFWVSDLREDQITRLEIANIESFVGILRTAGKHVFNLHGGYFSALLSKRGLDGFSHGIGYGESKDVVPVVGVTVPTVNYHLPPLHIRVPMLELERALSALGITTATDFHQRICDCTICKGILKGDLKNLKEFGDFVLKIGNVRKSQTPESAKRCRFHFLLARKKELDFVNGGTLVAVKDQLAQAFAEFSQLPSYLGLQGKTGHLRIWGDNL